MDFNEVKKSVAESSLLKGLDESLLASLLWNASLVTLEQGKALYSEGEEFDGTFSILLKGVLSISQGGEHKKYIVENDEEEGQFPVLGGFAYFHKDGVRSVTATVDGDSAIILKFTLSLEALRGDPDWEPLKERLSAATGRHWTEDQ